LRHKVGVWWLVDRQILGHSPGLHEHGVFNEVEVVWIKDARIGYRKVMARKSKGDKPQQEVKKGRS
jgi:hypothetical protein